MRKWDLKFNLFTRCTRFISLIAFSFLLLASISPRFLYATAVVKRLTADAITQKIIWREEEGRLVVVERGKLKEGEVLPDTCRVCVHEGEAVLDSQDKQVKLKGGDVFDVKDAVKGQGQKEAVEVTEGAVSYQPEIEQDGKRKPLGDPILIKEGFALLQLDSCGSFEKITLETQTEAQLPIQPGSEQARRAASDGSSDKA